MFAAGRRIAARSMRSAVSTTLTAARATTTAATAAAATETAWEALKNNRYERPTLVMVCDVQESFAPHIKSFPAVEAAAVFLCETAGALGWAVHVTEQIPFLPTTAAVTAATSKLSEGQVFVEKKTRFSMLPPFSFHSNPTVYGSADHNNKLAEWFHSPRTAPWGDVVIVGIEAHVCVQQTAETILASWRDAIYPSEKAPRGFNNAPPRLYVVADGVASQRTADAEFAIARLREGGAIITTTEAFVYRKLGDAKHPKFKQVLPAVKKYAQALKALSAKQEQ